MELTRNKVLDNLRPRTSSGPQSIYHTTRIKTYDYAGVWEALTASRPIFKEPGWVPHRDHQYVPHRVSGGATAPTDKPAPDPASIARAVRRAKVALRDYALSTPFQYFVTLTLDPAKVDRYDIDAITRKMQAWCSNQVQRRGLAYVLVPELHKDGAVHFHGFFNGALDAVDSGTIVPPEGGKPRKPRSKAQREDWLANGGHVVYNLPAWTLGWTTAMELYGEYSHAVAYVCKYIGKQQGGQEGPPQKIGGRWYYSGGKLGKPSVTYADGDICEAAEREGAYTFAIPEAYVTLTKETGSL